MNRHYSEFKERILARASKSPRPAAGSRADPKLAGERTAAWPTVGSTWKSSFNRATKVPVVKQYARKHGID